ncbi:hypothetical protein FRC09_007460 [Ceratobasidium sp. 395]|nr:hypothetical protein FRC09_007460 [Ceratobasidium sp. 395]
MTAATLLSSVYGYEASYPRDRLVEIVETATTQLCEAAIPANFLVNTVPWLIHVPSWMPGANWKRKADEWRAGKDKLINEPFEWTRSQIAANIAAPSILRTLLNRLATNGAPRHGVEAEEDIVRWVIGTLYAAGADTTVATMTTFVLAMVLHPEVQRKAQEELDLVLGGRLPELSDRKDLPYLDAVMKEVMRWRSIVPMGVPHATSKEDFYRGFRIPKGSIVLANIWAISNNPSVYPEPQKFNPDRFLDPTVPPAPVFGYGRRYESANRERWEADDT